MRSSRPAAVLLAAAALVAGCGDSDTSPSDKLSTPTSSAPAGDGTLRVGATTIDIGDATTGSRDGVTVLPNTKVPPDQRYREGVGAGASCENTDVTPVGDNLEVVVDATLCLLNGERADRGLSPLSTDDQLAAAARNHTADMIRVQFFDHVAPDGSTPVDRIRRAGYIPKGGAWTVGENLAWGTGTLATPKNIVKAWMNSEGHRANILRGAFKQIGFGVLVGNPSSKDGEGATYTTTFGGKSTPAIPSPRADRAKGDRKTKKAKKAKKARAAKRKLKKARFSLG